MAVLNQANVRNAKRHLATMAGVLKSVASGDSEGAIQTLESIVGGDDHEQFEDLLDSQETLAHLIKIAEASVDEDEEDSEEDFDEDEDDEDEEDEEVVTSSVKSMNKKQMKQRAKFLAIAEAEFEEDEEEDFDEEEDLEEDEDLDEEETLEEDEDEDEDADDEDADDEVVAKTTARFKANLKSRSKAQAGVAKPKVSAKAPKAKSDGRL